MEIALKKYEFLEYFFNPHLYMQQFEIIRRWFLEKPSIKKVFL
jgi:hypothetical protein